MLILSYSTWKAPWNLPITDRFMHRMQDCSRFLFLLPAVGVVMQVAKPSQKDQQAQRAVPLGWTMYIFHRNMADWNGFCAANGTVYKDCSKKCQFWQSLEIILLHVL